MVTKWKWKRQQFKKSHKERRKNEKDKRDAKACV